MIEFILTQLLIAVAFIIGVYLACNSPEEMKPGMKYFQLLRKITLGVFLIVTVWQLRYEWITLILFALAYGIYALKTWKVPLELELTLGSIAFFTAYHYDVLFIAISAIVHNLVLGTIWAGSHECKKKTYTLLPKSLKELRNTVIIIVISVALILL